MSIVGFVNFLASCKRYFALYNGNDDNVRILVTNLVMIGSQPSHRGGLAWLVGYARV